MEPNRNEKEKKHEIYLNAKENCFEREKEGRTLFPALKEVCSSMKKRKGKFDYYPLSETDVVRRSRTWKLEKI